MGDIERQLKARAREAEELTQELVDVLAWCIKSMNENIRACTEAHNDIMNATAEYVRDWKAKKESLQNGHLTVN